jgi:UDP-glucose 4-epimerase
MRIPDISLLTEMTGWRPTRSTERAIADCIEYLRKR